MTLHLNLAAIITWAITGLVIGAIAHLLVPGRQRIGILLTIGFGVVGALVGGIVTTALLGAGHVIISFIVALVVAALLISAVSHPRSRLYYRSRRRIR
ncbi:MAG TPA: GlsB/YeaQ/YmgE family stress response membrane protein [Trebonia sp.]